MKRLTSGYYVIVVYDAAGQCLGFWHPVNGITTLKRTKEWSGLHRVKLAKALCAGLAKASGYRFSVWTREAAVSHILHQQG